MHTLVISRLTSGQDSLSVSLLRHASSVARSTLALPSIVYRVDDSSTSSTALFNMPSPSVHLTSRRYTTHPLYSDLPAKALETATVKDLKAVVWYHATRADRTRASASRVVDPRGWSKLQLVAHVRGALRGYARKVAGADLASITAQYHRESADNSLVAGLLASVAASDSEADDEEEGGDGGQSEDGSEEGQGEESDHESSNERSRAEGQRDGDAIDDDDEPGSGGDGESGRASTRPSATARSGRGRSSKVAKLEATALRTGASKTGKSTGTTATTSSKTDTAARLGHTTQRVMRIAYCVNCGEEHDVTAKPPGYCSCCGAPWRVPKRAPDGAPQTATTMTSTGTATVAPTVWQGAASFRTSSIDSLIPASHQRQPGLAPLDEKIVKQAREGKQHYPLSAFLPLCAEDRSAPSSIVLNDNAILFDTRTGTLTTATGSAATSIQTSAARRRNIAGFSEIHEAITFSLIGIIYAGRPDICQQLLSLTLIAADLTRAYGWRFALDYVELVRMTFYHSAGGPAGRHCLSIDSAYDMGKRDMDALLNIKLSHSSSQAGKENTRPASDPPGARQHGSGKQKEPASDLCRRWNTDTCSRSKDECKFGHRCSKCGDANHPATRCAKTSQAGTTSND